VAPVALWLDPLRKPEKLYFIRLNRERIFLCNLDVKILSDVGGDLKKMVGDVTHQEVSEKGGNSSDLFVFLLCLSFQNISLCFAESHHLCYDIRLKRAVCECATVRRGRNDWSRNIKRDKIFVGSGTGELTHITPL
jgi:hypothetical protein